ncbi:MAG: amino acid adenylation domain protein, partial [Firmicutes bacterium]|nr:amino acid adenylation domain protein [Bacillota bacterium]
EWAEIARESGHNPERVAGPDNLAYVIFTSGSSGRPKGVMIEHRSLVNLLLSMLQRPGLTDQDVFVALAPIAFDMSVPDMFLPLIAGARMVIAPREAAGDGRLLGELLERSGATVLPATPATWRLLLESGWQGDDRLVMLCGGEALPRELADRLLAAGSRLWNLYGPTEATVWATLHDMAPGAGPVTVGRPMPNMQVYILDGLLQPVPAGVAGEVHIGGAGLARGYLNRPELTAEKFIADPFRVGGRLYKTGDLARFLPDGTIEHLGRIDDQVKVRGFRIELGEIEVLLSKHPAVTEAVVTTRADTRGDQMLVAYFVSGADQPPTVGELRSFLREQLPEYMIPGIFVALERIPLSANGKVDRRALPAPEQSRPELESAYVTPRTPAEELLAGIWAELLDVAHAGLYDNFFELGGHSLLATQAISRVRDAFAVDLPLRSIFQNPTVAGMAEAIEAAVAGGERMAVAPILPISRDGDLPLSFAQQRLWFVDQFEPATALYNIPAVIRLSGPLDVAALEQSLNEIIRRHETLRATFSNVDGQSVQRIAAYQPVPLRLVSLTAFPNDQREAAIRRVVDEEAGRPFDLARGPLLRATLLTGSGTEHVLVMIMHHIISDGWSAGVLVREAAALYAAFAAGQPSPLPELPVQYVDFAAWQRNWFAGDVHAQQLQYWRRQLDGVAVLHLPTDHPRPAVPTRQGATASFTLTGQLTERLKALSRQEGVTLFMTLLAAYQVLLHRYSGQADIAVGSPIANRNHVATEKLIGCFVNTLVLRTDLSGDVRFRELLGRVREVTMGAYAHQDMPFEQLVEALHPERNLSYTPLFQVSFAFDNTPAAALALAGLTITPTAVDTATAKFDLALSLTERDGVLAGALEYSTELFDEGTAARILGHYQTLLEGIVAEPERLVGELPLLTEPEEHQLLVAWNETADSYPRDRCIAELVAEQARRTPAAVAVVSGEMRLTYGELDRQANQLAHYLRRLGVGPDVLVGICGERSPELVVGLLAIVKAGGAYLPLDPAYPEERLAFMLADAGVSVLVTQERLLDRFPISGIQAVCLDRDRELVARERADTPVSGVNDTNLAYVIYTSGSTGQPKGVEIEHGGLLNLLGWHQRAYQVTAADRATHLAGFAFDASVWEIWPYLTAGASLYLPDEEIRLTPERLRDWLVAERITLSFVPTPMAEQLLLLQWPEQTPLRVMLTGGDKLHQYPDASLPFLLVNHYGPTENTVVATAGPVPTATGIAATTPSIGRPITNARVYLLDQHRQPVPVGVPGELHIGGDGLARGYRNRPDLTAERFVPNPFSVEPGARLYKTGDLARYLPDGNIEFLGRIDAQVKIRGFRVELGEIEAVLAEHPEVQQAVVITREYQPGDVRLAAYVVPASITIPTMADLRSHLRAKLPDYMVPGTVTVVAEIPLTPNGKVDRKGLPEPDEERTGETAHVGPRDALELQLATIWEEVLGVRAVSVTANFFDLGGHSLIALRLLSQIHAVTGVQVPVPAFFQAPTVEQMAALLRRESGAPTAWSPLVPLHAAGSQRPLFCVHPGGGAALPYATLARYLGEDQPLYGFQARGLDGREAPAERVADMAASYVAAMRTVQPAGPYLLAGWSVGGVIAFEMAQQLRSNNQEVALLALLDAKLLDETAGDEASLVADFVRDFSAGLLPAIGPSQVDRSQMSDDEQLAVVLDIAVAQGLVPPDFDREQLRYLLAVFQANHRAVRRYTPKPYPGKAVLFVPEEEGAHKAAGAPRWQELIGGGLDVRMTPGSHQTMVDLPHVQVLAQMLKESIEGVGAAVDARRMGRAGA